MMERDGLLEEALARGEGISAQAVGFKKKAVTLKKTMNRRVWYYRICGGAIVLLLLAAIGYWIYTWFR